MAAKSTFDFIGRLVKLKISLKRDSNPRLNDLLHFNGFFANANEIAERIIRMFLKWNNLNILFTISGKEDLLIVRPITSSPTPTTTSTPTPFQRWVPFAGNQHFKKIWNWNWKKDFDRSILVGGGGGSGPTIQLIELEVCWIRVARD